MDERIKKYHKFNDKKITSDSQIHTALLKEKFNEFKVIVKDKNRADNDIYRQIRDGETVLHIALGKGQVEIVDSLLQIYQRDLETVEKYISDKNASLAGTKFWLQRNILVVYGDDKIGQFKRKIGINLDTTRVDINSLLIILKHNNQATPQVYSLTPRTTEEIELIHKMFRIKLIDGSLNLNYRGPRGNCDSYLHIAAHCGMNSAIAQLIAMGATIMNKIERSTSQNANSPFATACYNNQIDTVNFMLDNWIDEIDLYERNTEYNYPILQHLIRQNFKMFNLLYFRIREYRKQKLNESDEAATNYIVSLDDKWNTTILLILLRNKQEFFKKEVLKCNPDFSIKSPADNPLIHYIIACDYIDTSFHILSKKTSLLFLEDTSGITPIHLMVKHGWTAQIKFFLEKDPKILDFVRHKVVFNHDYMKSIKLSKDMLQFIQEVISDYVAPEVEAPSIEKLTSEIPEEKVEKAPPNELQLAVIKFSSNGRKEDLIDEFLEIDDYSTLKSFDTSFIFNLLQYSEKYHNYKFQKKLFEVGVQTTDEKGYSLLHHAVKSLNEHFVEQLLQFDPNMKYKRDLEECTPLHFLKSVDCLKAFKKDISGATEWKDILEARDMHGMTVFLYMVWNQSTSTELLEKVLHLGADIHAKSNSG